MSEIILKQAEADGNIYMIEEVKQLLDRYLNWLRDKTVLRRIENCVEITTPFLDRHNDYIQIYIKKDATSSYILSDDGYTIQDIELSGCSLDSPKRQNLLKATLAGFGVQCENNEMIVKAKADNFPLKKHNLIQAILAVNDLFYLSKPHLNNFFLEDVTNWLDLVEIRYTPKVAFTGKSGFDHHFDFAIPKSRHAPERILKVINNPTRDSAQACAFSWIDTKEVRPQDSQAYAILNDGEHPVSSVVIEALNNYAINSIPWTKRDQDQTRELLAA